MFGFIVFCVFGFYCLDGYCVIVLRLSCFLVLGLSGLGLYCVIALRFTCFRA